MKWIYSVFFFNWQRFVAFCGPVYRDCEVPPTILHGRTELSVDDDGVVVTAIFSCDPGYKLHGLSKLNCDPDTDIWQSDLPTCKLGNFMISEKKHVDYYYDIYTLYIPDY